MIAISSNWKDLQKYYEHSYIKIPGFGDKLFYVNRVTKDLISGHDSESTVFELWLSDSLPFAIDYILPHHAVFQYQDRAVQLRRRPTRQYRRGLHPDNVRISDVLTEHTYDLSFNILEAYVGKQQYPTLKEAIASANISTALTNRMAYVPSKKAIYLDTFPIALVVGDEIRVTKAIFFKELQQYANTFGIGYKVTV